MTRPSRMNEQLRQDLEMLAKKHNMELSLSCLYCARKHETFDWPNTGDSFIVTLTELTTKPSEVLSQDDPELVKWAKDFIAWRNGPEGPEVLFSEGAKLLKRAQDIVSRNKNKHYGIPSH